MSTKVKKKAHAKFGASTAKRWLSCPGSTALSAKAVAQFGKPPESPSAKEGTIAHECLEFLVKNRLKLGNALISARKKWSAQMIVHAEMALKVIEDYAAKYPGAEVVAETEVPLPVSEPGQFGTTDVSVIEHFGQLVIIDYKYGQGIVVDPEENEQLIYYALGVAHLYDYNFSGVTLVIIQPRAARDGKFVRAWDTTVENLLSWRDRFEAGIRAAKAPNAPLSPGDHCRFCPARVICPALKSESLKRAQAVFDDSTGTLSTLTSPSKDTIPPSVVPRYLEACDRLETWIQAVREFAFNLARREKIPGYKLVQKRGVRKWNDYDDAAKRARMVFGDKACTEPELLSPAQIEKLDSHGKIFADTHSTNVSSGLTLVEDKDPRPATSSAAEVFEIADRNERKKTK